MKIIYSENDKKLREAMFSRIADDMKRVPAELDRVILVVPAQMTLSAEEDALLHIGGRGFFSLNIVSWQKLNQDILSGTGGSGKTAVSTIGRSMILRRAVKKYEGRFRAFSGVCQSPGFIDMAGDMTVQMKQNGISQDDIAGICRGLDPDSLLARKLHDIKMISSFYEEAMAGKFTDSEDSLLFVSEKLKESSYIKRSKVYFYGFYSFTARERHYLENLDSACCDVVIALLSGSGRRFAVSRKTMDQLGAEPVCIPADTGDLAPVRIVRCAGAFTEAETVASVILSLTGERRISYSDIMILTPDAPGYAAGIKRELESVGIPVFMDETRPIMHSSCAEAVSALMALAEGSYKTQDVLRLLKSGVLGTEEETAWGFENYIKRFHVSGSRFVKPLKYTGKDISDAQFASFEELRRNIASLLEPFAGEMSDAETVNEKADIVYGFLKDKLQLDSWLEASAAACAEEGFADTAEETRQMWDVIVQILEQMRELLGEERVSTGEFGEILLGALSEVKIGVLPQAEGRVQIGSVRRTIFRERKIVFITGFCDGLIPADTGGEGILTEKELSVLEKDGKRLIKPRETLLSEEIYMLYKDMYSAAELLYICIPAANAAGDELKQSPLTESIKGIARDVTEENDVENSGDPLQLMHGRALPSGKVAAVLRSGLSGEAVPEVWKAAYNILSEDAGWLRDGLMYRQSEKVIGTELAGALYANSGSVSLSPSRLDNFASCPFRHFVTYGLRPVQERPFGIASAEMGDIYHEALLKLCQFLCDPVRRDGKSVTSQDSPWMTVSCEQVENFVSGIIDEMAETAEGGVMTFSAAESFTAERIKSVCARFAWHMVQQVRAGNIDSMWFETEFRRGAVFPPIVLKTAAGNVYVEGKIDRVDAMPGPEGKPYIKIVDYKSGNTRFNKSLIERGLSLQLMTYLEGAIGGLGGQPAGIYYFRINADNADSAVEELSSDELSEKVIDEINKKYRLDGITVGTESVLCNMDKELLSTGRSDVIGVGRKKDGSLTGSLISPEDMEAFREDFRKNITEAAERICRGDISVSPVTVKNTYDSCRYCEYESICLKSVRTADQR